MFIKLTFFKKSQSDLICSNDFENEEYIDIINSKYIVSISHLQKFQNHLYQENIGDFAVVKMINNDIYHIKKDTFIILSADIKNEIII